MSTTLRRTLVVLGCYALSGYGLLLSLLLVGMSVGSASTLTLVGLPILLAWLCHLSMSWHWVCNRPSSALVRAAGTLAALLGLLLWPQVLQQPPRWALADTWSALAMGGLLTLPCVLLGLYLLRWHLLAQRRARMGTAAPRPNCYAPMVRICCCFRSAAGCIVRARR